MVRRQSWRKRVGTPAAPQAVRQAVRHRRTERCFCHQLLTQAARSSSLTGAAVGNRFGPEHVIVPMLTSINKDGD